MCPLSGGVCRCCYIVAITVATFLLVALLGGAVYSGVATTSATEKTSRKIFMSANETYNIVAGDQSAVLQRVCVEVDNTATSWDMLQGNCDAMHNITDHQHITGSAQETMGYFFYLLRGSRISVKAQGNGDIRIYQESDPSKVNQLEELCLNDEEPPPCEIHHPEDDICQLPIQVSAHYYLCFSPNDTIAFEIDAEKVMYNTSEYEQCQDKPSAISVHKCCDLSQNLFRKLASPQCILVSATSEDISYLEHAINVTITAEGSWVTTGSLAAVASVVAVVLAIVVTMCVMVQYRVGHRHGHIRGFQFDWFKNQNVL